ncbi:MAG: hypothetical protein IKK49_09905 [Clostridia bacterium]|nr:hypothetical protein [Clostridia bacterium]
MKKINFFSYIIGLLVTAVVTALCLFIFCPAVNVQNPVMWLLAAFALFVFIRVVRLVKGRKDFGWVTVSEKTGSKGRTKKHTKFNFNIKYYIPPIALIVLTAIISFCGSTVMNATDYAKILKVSNADFSKDIAESVGTDSIALMDTSSAKMLGDREIGALSDVVSQFDVSDNYTQIDYDGKPVKVSALMYADFFKWINNRDEGVIGYVTVDPVSMSASFVRTEGMKYVPSAYFLEDAYRYLRRAYPTTLFENLHFEIDEDGEPCYVATVFENTVMLFGGKTVTGCIVLDPISGESAKYCLDSIPQWVDVVYYGDLICEQYNWYGTLQNGYLNSLFAKKDCKQITTYYLSDEEADDETPACDYGYVAKDGDIWIYTGVTSVNGDSSNIGFLLANERTGESRYYSVAGADEKSAMSAAEGEVQEKGYQASFPSLINVDGNPTYIMVLKDSGGLVKLYAAVSVEQYNIVATAATQAECIEKYKSALGIESSFRDEDITETQITVDNVKYIDIGGNTYIYLFDKNGNAFRAKAAENENMLLIEAGDSVTLTHSGKEIISCTIG